MNHRERVLTSMRHRATDRVPLFYRDVPEVEQRLLRDLQLSNREELLQYLDIDFRWMEPVYRGPALRDEATGRQRDIWGVEYQYTAFNEGAGYWEAVTHPLAEAEDPAMLDDYPWPTLELFDFSTIPEQLARMDEYAIMTAAGAASPGILQSPIQSLTGMEKSLMDMAVNPELMQAIIGRVMGFIEPFIERMLAAGGGRIDFLRIGDDFGTQNGLMFSRDHWRTFIRPPMKALKSIADKYGASLYLHSCGAVRELIPDFIESGVDILDPLQVKAAHMDPAELKTEFGKSICFSGGVDEQELLPQGTPDEVRTAVHRLLEIMTPDGGFFLGPTHNFQDDIPTANITAMYAAAREWTG